MSDVSNRSTIELDRALPVHSDRISSLAIGQVLRGRYVLKARLGTGGSGAVFKALDRFRATLPATQQFVALKILHAEGDCSEEALANFRLEFHCGQVLSHPNIVNVYDLDRDGDLVFFTMELLEGESLSNVLERLRPAAMRKSQAWQLIQQLCAGLAHAHEHGVVHGDLKPENIFITRQGELRILDFGAAHRFMTVWSGSEYADHALTFGTPAYASCEQLEGRPADPRDDLYALACICYEILAGAHPFESRPATLARDYGVRLVRPEGLTVRQWGALQKGLCWHRAGRSISVRLWMRRLIKERLQEQQMTPLQDLARSDRAKPKMAWRAAALVLVVTLTSVAVLARLRPPSPTLSIAANPYVASASPNEQPVTRFDGESAADFVATPARASARSDMSLRSDMSSGAPPVKSAMATPRTISVDPTPVRSDDHFAEIRLHRNLLEKNSSFTWWTEPATAKPDVDYVPESVAIQTFPTGYRSTRLYVRLLPDSRLRRSYFYVAIAEQNPHRGEPTVIRRQIWLPSSPNLQARR
jgi:serine/threonine protein kinase